MKKLLLSCLFCCFIATGMTQPLYVFDDSSTKVEIPFEFKNNFILVKVWLNKFIPLNFIFDTGAEFTILAQKSYTDFLGVDYGKEFKLIGADLKTILTAHLAKSIDIRLEGMTARNQNILVLEKDYFRFDEYAGIKIDGILGADMFRHFVVEINYKKSVITFHNPSSFKPKSKFKPFPVSIHEGKVHLMTNITNTDSTQLQSKLLIDSGAGLSLLLHTNTHPDFKLPATTIPGNIGIGLGGFMEGYLGRIHSLDFAPFNFNNLITSFQELPNMKDKPKEIVRDGIIGNVLLSKFHLIIDYHRKTLYLKPSKNYNKAFKYDKSGLVLVASGKNLKKVVVRNVVPSSPAAEVGILPGDEILSTNRVPVSLSTLSSITQKFQKKTGKKIRLKIKRNGKKMIFNFKLRDII